MAFSGAARGCSGIQGGTMRNLLRNLAYASIIVAATAVTVHQFSQPAEAQGSGTIVGYHVNGIVNSHSADGSFMLSNGDVYYFRLGYTDLNGATVIGNVWTGLGSINGESSTRSATKAQGGKKGQ